MVNSKKKLLTASGNSIAYLRSELNLTQQEMVNLAKAKYKLKISLRSLQNAEANKEVGRDVLNNIAYFFNKEDSKAFGENIITLDTIVSDAIEDEFKEGLLDAIKKEKDPKKFADRIKREKVTRTDSTYLTRVDYHDQVTQVIKKSKKRKIFYPFNPNQKEVDVIKKILTEINNIHESIFKTKKFNFSGPEDDTDSYSELDQEISLLSKVSDFSRSLEELNSLKLNLHVGNFIFHFLDVVPTDPSSLEQVDVGDPSGYHLQGNYKVDVKSENYAIFSFSRYSSTSMTFNYENEWFRDKLNWIVQIDKYSETGIDHEVYSNMMDYFSGNYGYFNKFQKVKSNLTKTDLAELITDEEREKIGEDYLAATEEAKYDDYMSDLVQEIEDENR